MTDSTVVARLTIDLDAVIANWRLLCLRAEKAECAAVVKADAYGLGALHIAPRLVQAGCRTLFVALLEEGAALRSLLSGSGVEIVVLSGLLPGSEEAYAAFDLVPVLNTLEEIARWQAFAGRTGQAQPAWIHLDTGMNRLGLEGEETARLIAEPERLTGLKLLGWMSHLACADQRFHPLTPTQLGRFHQILPQLPHGQRSLANSSGIFRNRAYLLDVVRPGAALYGINPTPEASNPMHPVVSLSARILQVRAVDTGMTVGYGASYKVQSRRKLATIAAGYADGILRSMAERGRVVIGGQPAPLVGRVSMDLMTVDVTDLPDSSVEPGGWAEIIGPHQSVDDIATAAGTIGYEILTSLSRRCPRVWLTSAKGDAWNS